MSDLVMSELGQRSTYDVQYNPDRLHAISRRQKREEIGIDPNHLPFKGFDCWNHYEVSWLNLKGKPQVAVAEIVYSCNTPNLIESKSLKLYFNSFNNSQFASAKELSCIVKRDLEDRLDGEVIVKIFSLRELKPTIYPTFTGICLDELDITCTEYTVAPHCLTVNDLVVEETLFSDLLKSNCLVTNQPDWGSVQIVYKGQQINHEGLLKYLVSFRNHNEFHEQCIERIFIDIMHYCQPQSLTVYGRYTRRGGLDINPYRSTKETDYRALNQRLIRQ